MKKWSDSSCRTRVDRLNAMSDKNSSRLKAVEQLFQIHYKKKVGVLLLKTDQMT